MREDSKNIQISVGQPSNLGRSKNTTESIKAFGGRIEKPVVTPEKFRDYKAASDERQRTLKGIAGWFIRSGVLKGVRNRNSIMPSLLVTLDMDYATPEFVEHLKAGKCLPGYRLMAHSTRSHTPEKPRLRIIIFLDQEVDSDRYQAASRIIAQMADPDMEWVDKVSFRPAQMMYFPTVSKDMEKHYIFYNQPGDFLNAEEAIDTWEMTNGSSQDIGNLPKTPDEDELRESQLSAEDPLDKKGPVGDFCRAYTITELVEGKDGEEGILAHCYEVTEWAEGAISRMSYTMGTTSNGAVVYEDKWVYSHHGSDPAQEQLVNAYDLVRIHLYGDEDKGVEKDTPLKDMPSTKKMTEFLRGNGPFREQQAESRYDLESMLTDDDVDYEAREDEQTEASEDASIDDLLGVPIDAILGNRKMRRMHKRLLAEKPPKGWISKELELTDDGIIKTTLHNIATIIMNDPRFWRKIAYNEFNYQIVITDDIKSKTKLIPDYLCKDTENGDRWQEIMDIIIRALIEAPTPQNRGTGYGIKVGKEIVHDAVRLAARVNRFHPIRTYLLEVDKTAIEKPGCIETVFIDYFGAEDNVYNREVSRLMMIASVARVMEPGCKFDHALIFEGPQGIGKSTGIKRLYGQQYFGEIDGDLKDRKIVAEQMAGKWAQELPELSSMHKSEANDAKAFMSRQHDDVRLSYDRNVSELPRQSVIYGTTNDTQYLRDTTGGRRYWPVLCNTESVDVLGLMKNRDSIWQDAYRAYCAMREATPEDRDLPLFLQGEAAEIAKVLQERARKMELWETWVEALKDWMDEEHTLQSFLAENGFDMDQALDESHKGVPLTATVCRVAFSQKEAMRQAFGSHGNVPQNQQSGQFWDKCKAKLEEEGWVHSRPRIAGVQKMWIQRPDTTAEERSRGFRVLNPAQPPESATPEVDDDDDDNLI